MRVDRSAAQKPSWYVGPAAGVRFAARGDGAVPPAQLRSSVSTLDDLFTAGAVGKDGSSKRISWAAPPAGSASVRANFIGPVMPARAARSEDESKDDSEENEMEVEQQTTERQPMAGSHALTSSATDSVNQTEGHSYICASGVASSMPAAAPREGVVAPPPAVSAPRGAAGPGAAPAPPSISLVHPTFEESLAAERLALEEARAAERRAVVEAARTAPPGFGPLSTGKPFKLRAGKSPDAALPWEFRLTRGQFTWLEPYDRWVRGATLAQDPRTHTDGDEFDSNVEDGEPQYEAEKVTCLLHIVFPPGVRGDTCFDARRPPAAQWKAFAHYGWDKAPPRAGQLLKLLVEAGESNCAFARRGLPPGDPGFAMTRREFLTRADDVRFNGQWRQDDDGARAPCDIPAEDFESDEDHDSDHDDWQPGLDATDVDVDACVRSEEA